MVDVRVAKVVCVPLVAVLVSVDECVAGLVKVPLVAVVR